jgi:DNA-binding NtrC family response regulator/serine/threonine protein kinase/tetratricopeptide (TPR) repeat protein
MRPVLPLRFETIQVLRETATSSTFVATDHVLARNNVVVKGIRKGNFTQDLEKVIDVFACFRGLRHPHIAGILDAGLTPKGDLFYVRDFAPATELFTRKDMELLNTLLGAVDFLHSVGRVHGSIKPTNVFSSPNSVQLVDPWVPQPAEQTPREEDVRFSAPEVLKGGPRTIESDLYSVGALLYRFFSGRDLFDDADMESLISRHIWASPRPLTSISYVSRTIADIVEALIHKDPASRKPAFESLKNELGFGPVAATRAPAFGITEPLAKAEQFLQPNPERLRVLLLEAPVGYGKTRFLEELRHRMAFTQPKLVFSTCPPIGRSPYITVAQWILSLHDRHCPSFDDPFVKRLQAFVQSALEPSRQQNADRLVQDLVDVIGLIVERTPVALVIEDIDRTKRSLSFLLDSLVRNAARLGLPLLLTSRPDGAPPVSLRAIEEYSAARLHTTLGPLGKAGECIASYLDTDLDRRSVAQQNSGGIPLFLEEYCKHQKSGIPPVVQRAILKLVRTLPENAKRIAEILSLFEKPVDRSVMRRIAGVSETDLEDCLSYLEKQGLSDNGHAIRHSLVRTLLHSRIPYTRRARLHASCYEILESSLNDKEELARHAYLGGLFEQAAGLYLGLGRSAFAARNHKETFRFYQSARQCCARSSTAQPETAEDSVSFARSRAFLGDLRGSRVALKALLKKQMVQTTPELLSSVYAALASGYIEPSITERIRLLNLAISLLPPTDATLVYRYAVLANALLHSGRLDEAEAALNESDRRNVEGKEWGLDGMRAMLLHCRGKIKEAAVFIANSKCIGLFPAVVKHTNLAVALEHLGQIHEAIEVQTEGLHEAQAEKLTTLVVGCLGNLGSMQAKLGNLREAEVLFKKAEKESEKLRTVGPTAGPYPIFYPDAATCWIERGYYRQAALCLERVRLSEYTGYPHDTFQVLVPHFALNLALGRLKRAAATLDRSRALGSQGGYLDVERLLIDVRLRDPSDRVIQDLKSGLEISIRLGTRYQKCRLLITLARTLSILGSFGEARVAAIDALDIAKEGGYRLLTAYACLEKGIASDGDVEKMAAFTHCLQEASKMDLRPLLAECALRIGVWRAACGDYSGAHDYLYRSVATTTEIAESLSRPDRRRFLALPLHAEARKLLENATVRSREFLSDLREPLGKDALFFRGVYRLTSSLKTVPDSASAISSFVDSVRQCIPVPGVVVFQDKVGLTLHATTEDVPDGMKQRAIGSFKRADSGLYFGALERAGIRGSSLWISMPSSSTRAGVYVESPSGATGLDEQEIQFLTVASTLVAKALDQGADRGQESIIDSTEEFHGIVGSSAPMKAIYSELEIAARNSASVLIEGESGTGKEIVAKVIHAKSARSNGPFVPVDCGALPEGLIEAELFGTRKGAFTGAAEDRRGLFESADQGTIFLDEISNASLALQTRLLRILQEREVRRVGDTRGRPIDVRLIAATNRSLEDLVKEGEFRQDLLFRLKVLHIQLPPLRARRDDIPLLATTFLNRLNSMNQIKKSFGVGTLGDLALHQFPGNVRELQNAIERSFYAAPGQVITKIVLQKTHETDAAPADEMEGWFRDLTEGKKSFWSAVHDRYKRRDISRERVLALVDLGLRSTQGNYKAVASMFKIKEAEYRRFMDFLRRNDCLLDFRPYRKAEEKFSRSRG